MSNRFENSFILTGHVWKLADSTPLTANDQPNKRIAGVGFY